MKSLSVFAFYILCLLQPLNGNAAIRDTIPTNIKNYSKEQFLKEYGKDETSQKIIRYYFYRSKNAKQSLYIFPTLTLLSGIYFAVLSKQSYPGTLDDGYIFLGILSIGYVAAMFLALSIQAAVNHKKYSPQKLYEQLKNYQTGKPLPKKLKRQIKYFRRQ